MTINDSLNSENIFSLNSRAKRMVGNFFTSYTGL